MVIRVSGNTTTSSARVVKLRASVSYSDARVAVTSAVPAASVAYILLNLDALLDTTGRFRYVPEIVVVSDAVALSVSKQFSDAVSMAAVADTLVHEVTKGLQDSVGVTDVLVATLVFLRDFADSVTATDAPILDVSKSLADAVEISETAVRAFIKSLSDGVAMNDSFDLGDGAVYSFTKGVSNVVFANDALTSSFAKALADTQVINEALSFSFSSSLADGATVADALSFASQKYLADTFTLVDNASKLVSKSVTTDSFGVSDSVVNSHNKPFSDMIAATSAGSLLSQGYCDLTYFAEDYVGETRTFS